MIEVRETTVNELALVQGLWADGDVMCFVGFPEGLHQTDEVAHQALTGYLRGRNP